MKRGKWIYDNRGSVTLLAIGVMAFLGIILSGVMPMITQEVRMGTLNRDAVEAQYAAEAGAKRAVASLLAASTDWSWLNAEKNFTGETGKTYKVGFTTSTSVCKVTSDCASYITPTNGTAPTSGCYCLQSTGKVNGMSKKVAVATKIAAASMPAALSSIVFGNANIIMNNTATINGSAGTNGYIQMTSGNAITGVATYNTTSTTSSVITTVGTENPVTTTLAVPTFTVTYTTPTAPAVVSATNWPYGTWAVNNTASPLASGYYSSKGQLDSGASTIVIQPNTTIYVTKNDLSLYQSTWTMGDNAVIYIMKGDLKLNTATTLTMPGSSTVYIGNGNNTVLYGQWGNPNTTLTLGTLGKASLFYCNGNANIGYTKFNINGPTSGTDTTKVYFTGDLDLNGGSIMNIAGNVEIYISGTMKLSNDVKIITADNSKVTLKVGGYSELNSSATITTGTNSALALLIDSDAHFTNNTVINKAVVIATGNISMDSNASITGAVVSTGTTITMSNNSQITTDPDTVALVWDNILSETSSSGSSGSSSSGDPTIEKIYWQSN